MLSRSPLRHARSLLRDFFRLQSAGGIVLMAAAAAALVVANSPWHGAYEAFREFPLGPSFGGVGLVKAAELWINDGLMAVFFLLVALEIKREALSGQLSSVSQMLLPVLCAVGGVAVPAALYVAFNSADPVALRGWAIPTATDIAFALGILSLLGSRVPLGMKLLLSTIAVVDDLVAILIIAIFYTAELHGAMLAWAGAGVLALFVMNRAGVVRLWPYLVVGAVVWYFVLKSGVHATLAGVVTGLMIPLRGGKRSPLETLEHALHPWVAYLVLPLFAFTNAGLALSGMAPSDVLAPVPLGIVLGLVVGKPVGIFTVAWLAKRFRVAPYPAGMGHAAMFGLAMLCGVGFTMSLFITNLGFASVGNHLAEAAVLGVLTGSLVAAVAGWVYLRLVLQPTTTANGPEQ